MALRKGFLPVKQHPLHQWHLCPSLITPVTVEPMMHHTGISFHGHVFFHLHAAKLTDLSDVISSKIHQHIVLCQLFFILQGGLPQGPYPPSAFFPRGLVPARGKVLELSIFQLHQCLRGSSGDLDIIAGKIEHIGGWIGRTQYSVGVKQASFCFRSHRIGQEPPGRYPPHGYNAWLFPPCHSTFPLGTGALFRTSAESGGKTLLFSFLDQALSSLLSFCTAAFWYGFFQIYRVITPVISKHLLAIMVKSNDIVETASDPGPGSPAVLRPLSSALARCI